MCRQMSMDHSNQRENLRCSHAEQFPKVRQSDKHQSQETHRTPTKIAPIYKNYTLDCGVKIARESKYGIIELWNDWNFRHGGRQVTIPGLARVCILYTRMWSPHQCRVEHTELCHDIQQQEVC